MEISSKMAEDGVAVSCSYLASGKERESGDPIQDGGGGAAVSCYLASGEEGEGGDPIQDGGGWSCRFPFLTSPLGRRERVAIPSKMAEDGAAVSLFLPRL